MKFYCCLLVVVAMALVVNITTMAVDQQLYGARDWERVSVNDTTVVNIARQATHDIQLQASSAFKTTQILKAKKQIFPGGGIYKMSLGFGLTVCQALEDASLDTCLPVMSMKCKVIALVENSTEVLSHSCKLQPFLGGYRPMDVRSKVIKDAAMFAVRAHFEQRDNVQIRGILNAFVQVVAGLNYAMRIEIFRGQLGAKTPGELNRCTVIVWDQPWRTPRLETTYFQCD